MTKNKICLIPDMARNYNIKMVTDFAAGLKNAGYDAYHHPAPIEDNKLNSFVQKNDFDTLLRINRLPPAEEKRTNNFRHISWFQDVFPSLSFDPAVFGPNDLVFTLGTREVLGFSVSDQHYGGQLNLYIDPNDFSSFEVQKNRHYYDFNLIGFIPNISVFDGLAIAGDGIKKKKERVFNKRLKLQMSYLRRLLAILIHAEFDQLTQAKIRKALRRIYLSDLREKDTLGKYIELNAAIDELEDLTVKRTMDKKVLVDLKRQRTPQMVDYAMAQFAEQNYTTLGGALDIKEFEYRFNQILGQREIRRHKDYVDFCIRELPRFLDRYEMVKQVTKLGKRLILCGENWDKYEISREFYAGSVTNEESFKLFNSSKITLQNNNHGIGLHSRTLSAMAAGGFIMTHKSPRDELPGGMKSVFEPGIHYGEFTIDSLLDESRRWLKSDNERNRVAERAQSLVLSAMNWTVGAGNFGEAADL